MTDIFSGDPLITVDTNGADLTFKGGQPVMDQGLENQTIISLLTEPGWPGNIFLSENSKMGSDFIPTATRPITIKNLTLIEQAAARALRSRIFGEVDATVSNPTSSRLDIRITIRPPGETEAEILLTRNGFSWQAQANNPAHERVK